MVFYRSKAGLRIAELWYDPSEKLDDKTDIVRYKFIPETPIGATAVENLFTITIDLTRAEDEIWKDISKSTKYEIKRARERDATSMVTTLSQGNTDEKALGEYIDFFNEFAKTKDRGSISYNDLASYYETSSLVLRAAVDPSTGAKFAMHAYVVCNNRCRLMQSSSHFRENDDTEYRRMIGRANRFLHWDDMMYFKNIGISTYDMGGWYGGETDKEKLAINEFKESFGGSTIPEFSCIVPLSAKGKISTALRGAIKGIRHIGK